MSRGIRRFTQLRAWQACVAYKRAVADFARFVVIARSSLMESQNHLLDLRNARRARERRIASRQERRVEREPEHEPEPNPEPEPNLKTEHEPSSENQEE